MNACSVPGSSLTSSVSSPILPFPSEGPLSSQPASQESVVLPSPLLNPQLLTLLSPPPCSSHRSACRRELKPAPCSPPIFPSSYWRSDSAQKVSALLTALTKEPGQQAQRCPPHTALPPGPHTPLSCLLHQSGVATALLPPFSTPVPGRVQGPEFKNLLPTCWGRGMLHEQQSRSAVSLSPPLLSQFCLIK